jgi:hypothetical protein
MSQEKEIEDLVYHPNHYCKYNVELESIDVVDLFSFNLGSCMKYAIRFRDKDNPIMDLEKAIWYAERIDGNLKKTRKAIRQLKKYKPVLEIYKSKAKDIITFATIDFFIECIKKKNLSPVLELLHKRLNYEKSKPVAPICTE